MGAGQRIRPMSGSGHSLQGRPSPAMSAVTPIVDQIPHRSETTLSAISGTPGAKLAHTKLSVVRHRERDRCASVRQVVLGSIPRTDLPLGSAMPGS